MEESIRHRRKTGINQKAMSLKVDTDLWEWLQSKPNKNGYINKCLRTAKMLGQ